MPLFIIVAILAGCTADQARGISRLQELEKDFDRGQSDYYSDEQIAQMSDEFPDLITEIRTNCTQPTPAVTEVRPAP